MHIAAPALIALLAIVPAQASIFTKKNARATFYYDTAETSKGHEACGSTTGDPVPAGWADSSGINKGIPYCEYNRVKTLDEIGTNNIVAINAATLSGDPSKYCGREVQITKDDGSKFHYSGGKLYIWDGCQACQDANSAIIDLSAPAFVELKGETCLGNNPEGLTYEVLDNYVVHPSSVGF
ncbi:hypothetical protein L198_00087 [Cryptococcus wingfieldii CBS 7118]|uniref:Barwin domain-containing protein n=1 Tax=Cryptococcus wingfieldii CBS 7118 TaxID=1295528 RepID=A0A1E3K807_9TREE|nr:hypothetical protein L198_00087 [Cryptococcus wingfieldii CBS 7118]ODO08362.1 hypothetical protein L198_00087 [Cryptococcus wingfieldii CBS 7118]